MDPIRFDGDYPVYTLRQVHMYGEPYLWGIEKYLVISTLDDERPPQTDWKFEQERRGSVRPIHRYIRKKRFEYTLFQLLGFRGTVEQEIVDHLLEYGFDKRPGYVWNSIRSFLKIHKYSNIYYNRIPTIMTMANVGLRIVIDTPTMIIITQKFAEFNCVFDNLPKRPKYFPNMRFIALKFLEMYGAEFQFEIPLIRTKRKLGPLEDIWTSMCLPK